MRRLMPSVLALAVAVLVARGPAAEAAGADAVATWRVSGTITGTYENATGWVACPVTGEAALVRERVRVDVRLRPAFTAQFTRRTGMVARFKVAVGGTWSLTGSYPPLEYPPAGGDPTCGAQVPVDCAGPVVSRSRNATLDFGRVGRRAVGYFNLFPEVVESAVYADPDPARPFCSQSGSEPTRVVPLFGLASTSLAARAAPSPDTFPVRVPISRLLGHRRFAVLLPPARLEGCPSLYYTPCEESGSVRMRLTFTPGRG
jgi:hypothetical protein